ELVCIAKSAWIREPIPPSPVGTRQIGACRKHGRRTAKIVITVLDGRDPHTLGALDAQDVFARNRATGIVKVQIGVAFEISESVEPIGKYQGGLVDRAIEIKMQPLVGREAG